MTGSEALGEARTVEEICMRHGSFIGHSLFRFGVRQADIADLSQEVLLVVNRHRDKLDEIEAMRAWLYGICRKVAASHRRRAVNRQETVALTPTAFERAAGADPSPDPHAAHVLSERRQKLTAVFDAMDLERRALLVMFEIEELDCATIAMQLEIPIGTVYSRLNKARDEFKRCYERIAATERGRNRGAR